MIKPSWLFRVIAVLSVFWNAFAVFDFWMTSSGNAKYLQEYDPKMIEWIAAFPFWRTALRAVGVFAGLFGALALVLRRRVAVALLLSNFVLMVLGFAGHDILLADGAKIYGPVGLAASALLIAVAAGQWIYADRAAKKGFIV